MLRRAVISFSLLAGVCGSMTVNLRAQTADQSPAQPPASSLQTTSPQTAPQPPVQVASPANAKSPEATPADAKLEPKPFLVDIGTHIPLSLSNSVSTKNSVPGDRVYLETIFPILAGGRIVIPPGSYVEGTITEVMRPGKVKGRGEFHLRFDTLILPNGTTRDFRARVSGIDGRASEELDRKEGTIRSEGNKSGDVRTVGETTATGAGLGGSAGMGAGIGAAAGATAGLIGVLFTRGPDAVLAKGTTLEMVLDRPVQFEESELDFSNSPARRAGSDGGGPLPSRKTPPVHRLPIL
jgi:type IV secretion system protein VirB10